MSDTIGRQTASYRQGLVLGLTMAEIMLLLVFCLLIAVGVSLASERAKRDDALMRLKQVETAAASNAQVIQTIRRNARLADFLDRAAKSTSQADIDDFWRKLVESNDAVTKMEREGVQVAALEEEGAYAAKASFPEQATFPAQGHILAFNGLSEGQPVILAHVYGASPAPSTGVITFYIRRPRKGGYGTVLNANLPTSLQGYGYLKRISLDLHRSFTYKGARRSYLSASCAAPAGFPGATFPFARASMRFEGGVTLASTIIRSCKVKR